MISWDSSSSSTHSRQSELPKLIQPRQIRLTLIPVSPSVVYSIGRLRRPSAKTYPGRLAENGRLPSSDEHIADAMEVLVDPLAVAVLGRTRKSPAVGRRGSFGEPLATQLTEQLGVRTHIAVECEFEFAPEGSFAVTTNVGHDRFLASRRYMHIAFLAQSTYVRGDRSSHHGRFGRRDPSIGMPTYRHESRVHAPLADVWKFHSKIDGLEALTPGFANLRVESARGPDGEPNPEILREGAAVDLSIQPFGVG